MKKLFRAAALALCVSAACLSLTACGPRQWGGSSPSTPEESIARSMHLAEFARQSNNSNPAGVETNPQKAGCETAGRWLEWFAQDDARAAAGGERKFGAEYDGSRREVKSFWIRNQCAKYQR